MSLTIQTARKLNNCNQMLNRESCENPFNSKDYRYSSAITDTTPCFKFLRKNLLIYNAEKHKKVASANQQHECTTVAKSIESTNGKEILKLIQRKRHHSFQIDTERETFIEAIKFQKLQHNDCGHV
jgi:hypothetical protein